MEWKEREGKEGRYSTECVRGGGFWEEEVLDYKGEGVCDADMLLGVDGHVD